MSLKHCLYFVNVERDFYSKLAESDLLEDPSLTYDGLMKLSEEILPSTLLDTGGFMFELFVLRFKNGFENTNRNYQTLYDVVLV